MCSDSNFKSLSDKKLYGSVKLAPEKCLYLYAETILLSRFCLYPYF